VNDGAVRDAAVAPPIDGSLGEDGETPAPPPACTPITAGWHVRPDGTPEGDGSAERPWDLATALAQPPSVSPGDTIWLHEGVYRGAFTSALRGTMTAPIVVRQAPGEHATVDGDAMPAATITLEGEWTTLWGFEVMSSSPTRTATTTGSSAASEILRGDGVNIFGPGSRAINLVVHDNAQGFGFWSPATDGELYGNVIYNNGWDAPDRAHGHAIYMQNETGTKRVHDNVLFHSFSYGIHAYTEGGSIVGFDIAGNAWWSAGAAASGTGTETDNCLVGGLQPADRVELRDNFGWDAVPDGRIARLGYSGDFTNGSVALHDNYFVGGTRFAAPWSSIELTGNTFYGAVEGVATDAYPDNAFLAAAPAETLVVVRPNEHEGGRAHVIVYNWAGAATVDVDLSSVLAVGTAFEVRVAQDFFAPPVESGVFDGEPVTLPMTGLTIAQPIGSPGAIDPSETSGSAFQVFVVLPVCTPSP